MPAPSYCAESPQAAGIDPEKLAALLERFEREVRDGLLPSAQIAIARRGRLAAMRTVGRVRHEGIEAAATNDTLYAVFSATKAVTSAAAWLLIEKGALDPGAPVTEIVPEFGTNGKEAVLVEHLFTHTAGFPYAPFDPLDWPDREKRLARFQRWRLVWKPGTRFEYHPTATMWVLAEIIERLSGISFAEFVQTRIAAPLGLPDLHVGLPPTLHHRVADIGHVGDAPSPEELAARGFPAVPGMEAMQDAYLGMNRPEVRRIPIPGGGGFMTAGDLALFYQALLADGRSSDGRQVWKPGTIRAALRIRTANLADPFFGKAANRALGLVIAGDEARVYRGFGRTCSPSAFGHNGAGGQIAWADPATGISLAYCTNGFDRDPLRQGRRTVGISSRAAACAQA